MTIDGGCLLSCSKCGKVLAKKDEKVLQLHSSNGGFRYE